MRWTWSRSANVTASLFCSVMKPVKPQLDSIRRAAHEQVLQILTPPQRERLDQRTKEMESDEAKREGKTTNLCKG